MIIYSNTLEKFSTDVLYGEIADKIEECFEKHNYHHNNDNEYRSWQNSLTVMSNVLCNNSGIDQKTRVAIEYQIPLTNKRVDFIISGYDERKKENAVIIELKQWQNCLETNKENVVNTYVGKKDRDVTHPSYQAYSYAKTIENFNETVREKDIELHPCAFLHNFDDKDAAGLKDEEYKEAISLAPLFLKHDAIKLREFVKKYIKTPDDGTILYDIENGKIRPSKALQDAVTSLMEGNQEFVMIDEQQVAFATIKEIIEKTMHTSEKHTIIIEGGPGTGKSVIAVNLLATLTHEAKTVMYVTKNSAPREVFSKYLIGDDFRKGYVQNLFKGSGAFIDSKKNTFDCLLVDEAHRLNQKSGMFKNKGENQIKEIINASRISVFFIDEDQRVTTSDFGTIDEIIKQAKIAGSILHYDDNLKLLSQFRCNGSDGYMAFIDNLLGIRETANLDLSDLDYNFKVYDNPSLMRDDLRRLNEKNNKARMLAGYCYDWVSKKDYNLYDINLKDNFHARWNLNDSSKIWAIDKDSFEEVGCIHTSQGLEFDYVGVIIGQDLYYDGKEVRTDFNKRAKTDASLKGIKTSKNYLLADKIIRNTYRTLLTRGQKGCFVYCEDKALAEYIGSYLK